MTPLLTACSPNDSLRRVAQRMTALGAIALPVTDAAGLVVGVITLRDVEQAQKASSAGQTVAAVMTSVAHRCAPTDSVHSVQGRMRELHIPGMLVADEGCVVGWLTAR